MVEYVVTPAVIVAGISAYADIIVDLPNWIWWLGFYAVFVAINAWGTELTFKVALVIAGLSVLVLLVMYIGVLVTGSFDVDLLTNVPANAERTGSSSFLPEGFYGIWAALPFAIWFFLAIEQLPLAAEESHDVTRDMPKALVVGMVTLTVLALLTLVLNTGVGGGALEVGNVAEPLNVAFIAIFGEGTGAKLLAAIALVGLIASFHSIIYAYGRVLFAASRSGYIPREISKVSSRKTPARALVLGAVGGWVGFAISLVALAATVALDDNRPGVVGTAIFVGVMFSYYWFYSRHRLVANSPEEAIALLAEAEKEII